MTRDPGFTIAALCVCGLLTLVATKPRDLLLPPDPPQRVARSDRWRIIGPGGGGTTLRPTISPHDVKRVLVACDMTGAYLTLDGGESWRMFNLGTDVSSFAFDPSNPDVIYAGTPALWRSADRGRTWRMAFPDPHANTRELMTGDHAEYVLRSADPLYPAAGERMTVQAIAVSASGEVAIAMSGSGVFRGSTDPGFVLTSPDARAWRRLRDLPPERVLSMAYGPDERIALVTERHVYQQGPTGWTDREGPSGVVFHAASLVDTGPDSVVYGVPGGGRRDGGRDLVWISADAGLTWRSSGVFEPRVPSSNGPAATNLRFTAVAAFARDPRVAFVGFESRPPGPGRPRGSNGVARTDDEGRTWRIVHEEGDTPSPTMDGSWVEERATTPGPDIWFDAPYDLTVAPTSADVVYVTDLFRTYRTLDGGARWAQVHSRRVSPGHWTTRGLDVTTNYGVHADPSDPQRIFMDNTDIGLFRSEDGGRSWMISSQGIPQNWRNTTYWLAFDPADPARVWGAFSGTHDLPRPKMWRTRDPETYRGGLGLSVDGGRTWTPVAGLPPGAVTHVLIDGTSPVTARVIYACLFGRGVYKSADGGHTWSVKNEGLTGAQPFAWRLISSPAHRLYLVVSRRSENGRIGDDGDGALYVSDDEAEHWTRIALPAGTNGPTGLLVDPRDPARLYLSAWGVYHADGDTGGGIFLSTDAGGSWAPLFTQGQHVYDVTIDERTGTLYACGFDQAAWRSTDWGATWQQIAGYSFKWGHRVIPDPATPAFVYITTFGGGVWHGPASGPD